MALTARVDIRPTTHYTRFDFKGSSGTYVTGLEIDGAFTIGIGVFDDAEKYAAIGALVDALSKRLQVMDSTAFSLCMDNKMPIIVFDMNKPDNIRLAIAGEPVGTLVSDKPESAK